MKKGMIVILQSYIIKRAEELGYTVSPDAPFEQSNQFLILHQDDKTLESTNSKKIWSSEEYAQMRDDDFMRIPIPALVGEYCIERTEAEDYSVFVVGAIEDETYISTGGITYEKKNCSRISKEVAAKAKKLLMGL